MSTVPPIAPIARIKLTFLGTGTSVGVPLIGCECAVCNSTNPKDKRYRASVLLRTPKGNIVIDTGPEFRLQLLREQVRLVHAVLYTHYHADHLFGLDDLRIFPARIGVPVPLYCTEEVEEVIRRTFSYAFLPSEKHIPASFVPKLTFERIGLTPFEVLGLPVTPVPLLHSRFNVLGFRIGNVAYCTDVNRIPPDSLQLLRGLDVLILDSLRYHSHPAHLSVQEALELIAELRPKRAYLTHLGHELGYDELRATLPEYVEPAYDGLTFDFDVPFRE